jgi:predicted esterase
MIAVLFHLQCPTIHATRTSTAAFVKALSTKSNISARHRRTRTTPIRAISSSLSLAANQNKKNKMVSSAGQQDEFLPKPRVLCLHGKHQSGTTFSNKIGGARRKLARVYDLDFLDGPIRLNPDAEDVTDNENDNGKEGKEEEEPAYGWWLRDETTGEHTLVQECMEYVLGHIQAQEIPYQAVIGFSQGGVVATALCCSGRIPSLRAVVTAGAPMVEEAFAFSFADQRMDISTADDDSTTTTTTQSGYEVPKLHLAGETDAMISVASTTALCERGGNGKLIVHDQGHLFPTRAARVQEVLDFLEEHALPTKS